MKKMSILIVGSVLLMASCNPKQREELKEDVVVIEKHIAEDVKLSIDEMVYTSEGVIPPKIDTKSRS